MKRDDWEFMERINRDLEARRMAYRILGIEDMVSKEELKKAYRRKAMKFHPDKHMNAPEANKKFVLVKCAYELLMKDRPCPALLEEVKSWRSFPKNKKYRLDNLWGYFLWWRENYFDSGEEVKPDKPAFCI